MIQQNMIGVEMISEMTQEVKVGVQEDIALIGMIEIIQSHLLVMEEITETMGIKEVDMKVQGGPQVCSM